MKPMEVMIVEDESIVALDLKDLLEFMGYVVPGVTATGEESILMAENIRPDVVLMDIMLRGEMDGIEAAKIIREKLDIPVIYLTASTDDATLERASITGPFGYLIKPFNERELFATIEISRYRHEAEQKSKETARWLSALLMSMGEAVISVDTNGTITLVNPVAEQLIGLKTDELLNRNIEEVPGQSHLK